MPRSDFCWVEWEDDSVLFHRPSGKTHFLNTASILLLTRSLVEPLSLDEIIRSIAADHTELDEAGLHDYVNELMLHLEDLGLVARQ